MGGEKLWVGRVPSLCYISSSLLAYRKTTLRCTLLGLLVHWAEFLLELCLESVFVFRGIRRLILLDSSLGVSGYGSFLCFDAAVDLCLSVLCVFPVTKASSLLCPHQSFQLFLLFLAKEVARQVSLYPGHPSIRSPPPPGTVRFSLHNPGGAFCKGRDNGV